MSRSWHDAGGRRNGRQCKVDRYGRPRPVPEEVRVGGVGRCATMPSMTDPVAFTVERALVRGLKDREDARFRDEHPRCVALLERGRQVMPNGVPMA